jgi:hypothetical protein
MIQVVGMRDLRENHADYYNFVEKVLKSQDDQIQLYGWRYLLAIARAVTCNQCSVNFIDFIFE